MQALKCDSDGKQQNFSFPECGQGVVEEVSTVAIMSLWKNIVFSTLLLTFIQAILHFFEHYHLLVRLLHQQSHQTLFGGGSCERPLQMLRFMMVWIIMAKNEYNHTYLTVCFNVHFYLLYNRYLTLDPLALYHLMSDSELETSVGSISRRGSIQIQQDNAQEQFKKIIECAKLLMKRIQGRALSGCVRLLQDVVERSQARIKKIQNRNAFKQPVKRCIVCSSQLTLVVLEGCDHSCCHTCIAKMCQGREISDRTGCEACFYNFKLLEHASGIIEPTIPGLTRRRSRFPWIKIDLNLKQSRRKLEALKRIIDDCYQPGTSPLRQII